MTTRIWGLCITLLLSLANSTVGMSDDRRSEGNDRDWQRNAEGPLVQGLRSSWLAGWRNRAPDGYVPDPFCTSGANGGAMGIHFVNRCPAARFGSSASSTSTSMWTLRASCRRTRQRPCKDTS